MLVTEATVYNVGGASCSSAEPMGTVLAAVSSLVDRDGGA